MPPKAMPIRANRNADPTQKESSKVKERKKRAEKLVTDPAPRLPSSSAGAVANSKGKQNHAG